MDWLYIAFVAIIMPLLTYFGPKVYWKWKTKQAVKTYMLIPRQTMTADELRDKIEGKLDGLLGHRLLVRGEDRVLLQAFRDWLPEMKAEDLERVIKLMNK